MNKEDPTKRKKWFLERIGKRVFRNSNECTCVACSHIYENGLIIANPDEAKYLHDIESDYTAEGHPLRYFDTKEEVIEFEKVIK